MAKHILNIVEIGTSSVIQYKDRSFGGATVDVLTFDGDNGGAPAFSLPLTVVTPTAAGHAATKAYVDTATGALGAIVKRTVTITRAGDLAGLGGGVKTFSKNVGAALPANARLAGWTVGEGSFVAFDDATHGTFSLQVGTVGTANDVTTAADVAAGTVISYPAGLGSGINPGVKGFFMAPRGTEQIVAKITSSVDLNTATAGTVTINLFYVVLA